MRAAPLSNKSLTAIALVCASLLSSTAAHAVDVLGVYRTAAEQDPVIGAAKAATPQPRNNCPRPVHRCCLTWVEVSVPAERARVPRCHRH